MLSKSHSKIGTLSQEQLEDDDSMKRQYRNKTKKTFDGAEKREMEAELDTLKSKIGQYEGKIKELEGKVRHSIFSKLKFNKIYFRIKNC